MHFAVSQGVPAKLCAYISDEDLMYSKLDKDICVASAKFSVDSSAGRCGKPEDPVSADEIAIRKVIGKSGNGFNRVNESIEKIRLSYLAKYPIHRFLKFGSYSWCDKSGAIRKIKEGIESIIPRANLRNDLNSYAQYLQSEKLDDDEDKNFEAWLA